MEEPRRVAGSQLLGRTLSARYALRSLIGSGGMGDVYEAEDLRLRRGVAVKVLRADLAGDPRLRRRFEREARTAGSLSHANIVAVHDTGIEDDVAYVVMELVHGVTLADLIRAEAPLAPRRAARIGERVADALEFAHARGVVHRDVAPGNVMLTHLGEVKVLDFGIARAEDDRAAPASQSSAHGTTAYVAPERVRGDAVDRRADVYSLGAVLYELLTGAPPVGAAVRPSERQPGVHRELDDVVMRCLAHEPSARFARAGEVGVALAAAAGEAAQTRPLPSIPTRPDLGRPRRPTTPVLASAATLRLPVASTAPARSGVRRHRWLAAAATLLAGLAVWFVALPVWQAMSDPAAAPPPTTPLALRPPTYLSATGACDGFWSTRVELEWTPASTPASGFEIYRADESGGPYRLRTRVHGSVTTWTDRGLSLDETYRYLLRAVDGGRRSPLTPEVTGSTPLICLG